MRILLCNERFIFRFGVDRVLIMLGQKFKAAGHEVVVMANRFDYPVVKTFASHIITVPTEFAAYPDLNEWTAAWLNNQWPKIMAGTPYVDDPFDIALIGGWPFFSSIPVLKPHAQRVIFLDYGAVPLDGYPESNKTVLRKLGILRRHFLPQASAIIAGSDFLADTQSRPDSQGRVPVHTILAGSDHIDTAMWQAGGSDGANTQQQGLAIVEQLQKQNKKILLNLGRWEPDCYKNSIAAYYVLRRILPEHPDACLLILADPNTTAIPPNYKDSVFPIGFPDDRELLEIMRRTDVGLSVSLWEGHNLPLAEMQWLDRPALAFDLAAHPEVVLDPWYLCRDNAEMATKTADLLAGRGPTAAQRTQWLAAHRREFTWDRAAKEYLRVFEEVLENPPDLLDLQTQNLQLIFDVTNASRDTANSGVIRVTRRLARELQNQISPRFTIWDPQTKQYMLLRDDERMVLQSYNGPVASDLSSPTAARQSLDSTLSPSPNTWLIQVEVSADLDARLQWARDHHLRTAAVFHDAIPILRPDLVSDIVRQGHAAYMKSLASADLVVATSHTSHEDLRHFWRDQNINPHKLATNRLPDEFAGSGRITTPPPFPTGTLQILCVSTLEPRKNHRTLLAALQQLSQLHPTLDYSLTLVGNRYAGADDLYEFVQNAARHNPRLRLAGVVDDATLHRLYTRAAFTIYPSLIEGFGMPIVESLWHARPCICSATGVMGELATAGGCLTTNVSDPAALAHSIYQLATDRALYERLAAQAATLPTKSWNTYAQLWLNLLASQSDHTSPVASSLDRVTPAWHELVQSEPPPQNHSLNNAERLALSALLMKLRPTCSLYLGNYSHTALSLLQQYSAAIFSLDTHAPDHTHPHFPRISFLSGNPTTLLPALLKELNRGKMEPDFIFLNTAALATESQNLLATLLSTPPQQPVFILVRGNGSVIHWQSYDHIHRIDPQFLPPTPGISNGLTAIYLSPVKRQQPLPTFSS